MASHILISLTQALIFLIAECEGCHLLEGQTLYKQTFVYLLFLFNMLSGFQAHLHGSPLKMKFAEAVYYQDS